MRIPPEKWEAVKALFEAALEEDSARRSSFLQTRCDDVAVRAEVGRLLAEHDHAGSFLATQEAGSFLSEDDAATQRLAEGELLAGRFRIIRFIAAGGMGEVYEAEDQELHERVAVKTIRAEILDQPNALPRFKREVQLARKVTHPNVCRIFDLFRHRPAGTAVQETVFISMELLNGKTLDAQMKEAGRMSPDEAMPIVRSMASGLAAAHAVGIVHRDFKPGNVVLVRGTTHQKVRPVVTDFGLALQNVISDQSVGSSSTQGLLGTPAYMSPEQLEGRPATPASDVYALGLVIYEMVTGTQPFQGDTPVSAALKRLSQAPKPPRRFQPQLNSTWNSTILRCLERDPAKRFASVQEVANVLGGETLTPASGNGLRLVLRETRRPIVAVPFLIVLLTLGTLLGWWAERSSKVRWARDQALPKISRLIEHEKLDEAYSLAVQAERYIPRDPMLGKLWPTISWSPSITTTPKGVSVFRRSYNAPNQKWEFVGTSPIQNRKFPLVDSQWKFESKGFATVERATFISDAPDAVTVMMDQGSEVPRGMVHVELAPSASLQSTLVTLFGLPGFEGLAPIPLKDYWIDKFEVTNKEYKSFVDEGGYRNRKYWKYQFRNNGHILSWVEAMALFRDRTDRPGPATWVAGAYPPGQEDFPVAGVSWFEAAAYADFVGKSLPTIYHWTTAASPQDSASLIPASNFGGAGPARVGTYKGMSWSGAYDMAGNLKEWCFNESYSGKRFIMGGAWNEPTYIFNDADARSPFQRSTNIGFRCAKYDLAGEPAKSADPIAVQRRDFSREKPVSEQLFRAYKSLYSYDETPLHATLESTQQTSDWKMEKISFDAAYGNERVIAYLFLPRRKPPPFQTVVHFPGASAIYSRSFEKSLADYQDVFDFIIKSGRALMFPVYKGTFERQDGYRPHHHDTSSYRDHVIAWSKDLGRSIDYLETRSDIDHTKFGYEGYSWGAAMGSLLPAVENRLRALVLISPGFYLDKCLPEADQLNFAPRLDAPTLMLNGRFDFIFPPGSSQEPMFRALGTVAEHKRRVVYNTGHDIPNDEMIKETLNWLDRYLGTVK